MQSGTYFVSSVAEVRLNNRRNEVRPPVEVGMKGGWTAMVWLAGFVLGGAPGFAREKDLKILDDRTDAAIVSVRDGYVPSAIGTDFYTYTLVSSTISLKPVTLFAVDLGKAPAPITDAQSPKGWTFSRCGKPKKACWIWGGGPEGKLPPGGTLDGFSFRSPAPARDTRYFIANESESEELDLNSEFGEGFQTGKTRGPTQDLELPADIRAFQERAGQCHHWAGEAGYDEARSKEIERALRTLRCDRIHAELGHLRRQYAKQPATLHALNVIAIEAELSTEP